MSIVRVSSGGTQRRKTSGTFHVSSLHIQVGGSPIGEGATAPIILVWNAHSRREDHSAQEDGKVQ